MSAWSERTTTMHNTTSDLRPNLRSFTSLLNVQPPEVQEAFQFLLATAMQEVGKQARCSAWCGQWLEYIESFGR